ncbi:hypothetical protein JHK84_050097 [Glycine max]|nr:hypothetical protein JHK85_050824 [Glycine max]KAG5094509.1 hypothetical protein JHK84_050097 [Glycine max]
MSLTEAHGVHMLRDDVGLEHGEEIKRGMMVAIDDLAAFIVIISQDYASSRWCLDELTKICQIRRLVLPVFYRVDLSHVRHQKGPFEADFASHELSCGKNEVSKWREAFKKVGGVSVPQNLMVLNLSYCIQLIVIPDLSGCQHLEKTDQENCINLTKIHDSIGNLNGTTITNLPNEIGETKLLRKIEMMNCINLEYLLESTGYLAFLTTLNMVNGNIRELPKSIGFLENLGTLRLNKCRMLSGNGWGKLT